MPTSFTRRLSLSLTTVSKFAVIAAILVVGIFVAGRDAPITQGDFESGYTFSLSSTASEADADLTTVLTIPDGSYNFGSVVTSSPSSFVDAGPTNCNVAVGSQSALCGEVAATLNSLTRLGLANQACSSSFVVPFTMLNATVDITNTISPLPQADAGGGGILETMWTDTGDAPTADVPPTSPGPAEADGLPAHINMYPDYLNTIFTPDGGSAMTPHARYAGAVIVASSIVTLDFVVFEPGALQLEFSPPHPFADLDPSFGYSSVVVLNDPTQPASPSSITDFCTSLASTTVTFGEYKDNECRGDTSSPCDSAGGINDPVIGASLGVDRARNVVATVGGRTVLYTGLAQSLPDLDGDNIENSFDTCPYTVNIDGDPRATSGPDGDMLDSACDPTPNFNTDNGNHDGDQTGSPGRAWSNAGDNCPLASNGGGTPQVNTDSTNAVTDRQSTPRGGPKGDAIGDVCDNNPNKTDGRFFTVLSVVAICIGGTDGDLDGYCAADDPDDGNANLTPESIGFTFRLPGAASGSGVDADVGGTVHTGLGLTECRPSVVNGFDCFGSGSIANDGSSPLGNEDDNSAGIAYAGPGQPYQICNDGLDQDGDGLIDMLDNGRFDPDFAGHQPTHDYAAHSENDFNCELLTTTMPAHPGFPTCPTNGCDGIDTDGDGYTDEAEFYIGTDAFGRCEVGGPKHSTDWPADLDSTTTVPDSREKITITDITSFLAPTYRLFTSPGDAAFSPRWDLIAGRTPVFSVQIAIDDLVALIAGPPANPPMFDGAKAFNGPVCTAHPTLGD